jgi:redox-sensitive bicupin YhaK (pirin superfamily)
MKILHRDDLKLGGFAGLKEHRLVMDNSAFSGRSNPGTWQGIGRFIYLADAQFNPLGDTTMHSHKEVDVISVMVKGRVSHEGSLEHGQSLEAGQVQVQRAGGQGFSHNEINPDKTKNRMIQLWVLPEKAGACADYKFYELPNEGMMRVYGGDSSNDDTFSSRTLIDVGYLAAGKKVNIQQPFLMYITKGSGFANGEMITEGDLVKGDSLQLDIKEDTMIILIKEII